MTGEFGEAEKWQYNMTNGSMPIGTGSWLSADSNRVAFILSCNVSAGITGAISPGEVPPNTNRGAYTFGAGQNRIFVHVRDVGSAVQDEWHYNISAGVTWGLLIISKR